MKTYNQSDFLSKKLIKAESMRLTTKVCFSMNLISSMYLFFYFFKQTRNHLPNKTKMIKQFEDVSNDFMYLKSASYSCFLLSFS
jgi:hypothetical protein